MNVYLFSIVLDVTRKASPVDEWLSSIHYKPRCRCKIAKRTALYQTICTLCPIKKPGITEIAMSSKVVIAHH